MKQAIRTRKRVAAVRRVQEIQLFMRVFTPSYSKYFCWLGESDKTRSSGNWRNEAYPNLKFELVDGMRGPSSIILDDANQKGTETGEYMEFDSRGQIIKVVANYSV